MKHGFFEVFLFFICDNLCSSVAKNDFLDTLQDKRRCSAAGVACPVFSMIDFAAGTFNVAGYVVRKN
jgi:L-lactate utilization protein LutB